STSCRFPRVENRQSRIARGKRVGATFRLSSEPHFCASTFIGFQINGFRHIARAYNAGTLKVRSWARPIKHRLLPVPVGGKVGRRHENVEYGGGGCPRRGGVSRDPYGFRS